MTDSSLDIHQRVSTGSAGLDDILGGGLDGERMYLIEGRPGSGKTTIAMQFLLEGRNSGERVLYITMSETERELRLVAERHGWSLEGVDIFELVPAETTLDPERELTVLSPAEVELSETTKLIFDKISADQSHAHRHRQPVGAAAARAELVALSPAGARAQALFRASAIARSFCSTISPRTKPICNCIRFRTA